MPVAMRFLWVLGCMGMISTANAQPAPAPDTPPDTAPDASPDTAPTPAPDASPDTAPTPAPDASPDTAPDAGPVSRPTPSPPSKPPGAALPTPAPSVPLRPLPPGETAPGGTPPAGLPAETELDSYGWQLVLADAASVALMFSHDSSATGAGVLGYALAGSVIHGAHEQGNRALASLVLRIGLPLVSVYGLAALAKSHCAPSDDDCGDDESGAIVALGLGALAAMVLDDAVIARPVARPVNPPRTTGVTWIPQVSASSQQVRLGVLGQF
jgi:hypothetical protein